MERALIICDAPKAADFYTSFLREYGIDWTIVAQTTKSGKEKLAMDDFDLCVCHYPLTGERSLRGVLDIAERNVCQVILFVRDETMADVLDETDGSGIIVLGRPISKGLFRSALVMSDAVSYRMARALGTIERLNRKLAEEKQVGRAKCLLIAKKGLSEDAAHKFIERQAMDQRISRMEVAEEVIDFYV